LAENRTSTKARGSRRTDRIVSIDLSGPETAFVKHFTHYLTLIKLPGGWRTVAKTFRNRAYNSRTRHMAQAAMSARAFARPANPPLHACLQSSVPLSVT